MSVEGQVLEPGIGAIGNDEQRLAATAVVEPETVRCLEFPWSIASAAEGPYPLGVLVILMDVVRAVAIANIEAAVGGEGHVGRRERRSGLVINVRLRRCLLDPDHLPFQIRLDHEIDRHHATEIQELLPVLLADVDTMSASVVLLAEGPDELAGRVENNDCVLSLVGRFRLLATGPMLDVDETGLVDRHAMRLKPMDRAGHFAPFMEALVTMFTLANDRILGVCLVAGVHKRVPTGT